MYNKRINLFAICSLVLFVTAIAIGCYALLDSDDDTADTAWRDSLFSPTLNYSLNGSSATDDVSIIGWEETIGVTYDDSEMAIAFEKINDDPWGAQWAGCSVFSVPTYVSGKFNGLAVDSISFQIKTEGLSASDIALRINNVNINDSSHGISATIHPDTGEVKITDLFLDTVFGVTSDIQTNYVSIQIDFSNISEFTGLGLVMMPSQIGDKVYIKQIVLTQNGNPVSVQDLKSTF